MTQQPKDKNGPVLRDHVYDGIEEFDQKLPNWWLLTFYGAILFSVIFWFAKETDFHALSDTQKVDKVMAQIEAARLEAMGELDDDILWQMSQTPSIVAKGEAIFKTNCVACHGADLTGGIGVNLVDNEWLHGGNPMSIINTITHGVPEKGMQSWGPVLGPQGVSQAAAFILSHHTPETAN